MTARNTAGITKHLRTYSKGYGSSDTHSDDWDFANTTMVSTTVSKTRQVPSVAKTTTKITTCHLTNSSSKPLKGRVLLQDLSTHLSFYRSHAALQSVTAATMQAHSVWPISALTPKGSASEYAKATPVGLKLYYVHVQLMDD